MKYFIWRYNPSVVGIRPCSGITFVVPSSKEKMYLEQNITSLIVADKIDFKNVYLLLKKQKERNISIDDIFTLDEDIMDWLGVLKSIFVQGQSGVSDVLFKDKYYMRSVVNGIISEPNFTELTTDNYQDITINEGMIKPRRADSTKGIQYFKGSVDINSLKNENGYLSNKDLLVEDFVHYDRMFTVDGYTDFNGHERFFSHEYNSKLSDFKSTGYFTLHTNSCYYNNMLLLRNLFILTKKALKALSVSRDITPFHFEWFYSEKNNKLIFTEAGKRFGGVKLPRLIKNSFNIDILNEYWTLQEGKANEIDYSQQTNIPKCCSTSYVQLENGKKMNESFKNRFPNLFTYNQNIPLRKKSKKASSIEDTFFLAQYSTKTPRQSDEIAENINKQFLKECIK